MNRPEYELLSKLKTRNLVANNLTQLGESQRTLLLYVGEVECESFKTTAEDVQRLRYLGLE